MSSYIHAIEATGVYGRFDIHQEFNDGINIVFGKNGAGKTTLLHILANAMGGKFDRFSFLKFKSIKIWLSDGRLLLITAKEKEDRRFIEARLDKKRIYPEPVKNEQLNFFDIDDLNRIKERLNLDKDMSEEEREKLLARAYLQYQQLHKNDTEGEPIIPIAYFPAFRTMIEAWVAAASKREVEPRRRQTAEWKDIATDRARDWFGPFTPMVNFPSLVDIEEQLASEIEGARMSVWKTDQTLISDAFFKIFASLSDTSKVNENEEALLASIQDLFVQLEQSPLQAESRINFIQLKNQIAQLSGGGNTEYTALRVLKIYRDILNSTLQMQRKSFEGIERYLSSVNGFLEGKSLVFISDLPTRRRQSIKIRFDDNSFSDGLRTLSSGERQIMTLVYAATHMSQQQVVLIDEPEISLHIDWQRMLIKRMVEQMGDRQIIACTHSPVIGSDHLDKMRELALSPTSVKFPKVDEVNDSEEISF